MNKTLLLLAILVMPVLAFAGMGTSVTEVKGDYAYYCARDIGWNGGVPQVLISSAEAESLVNDWLLTNDPDGYTVFYGTSPIGLSTHTKTGDGATDSYGRKKMGYPLFAGKDASPKGTNRSGVWAICPISSSTVYIWLLKYQVSK